MVKEWNASTEYLYNRILNGTNQDDYLKVYSGNRTTLAGGEGNDNLYMLQGLDCVIDGGNGNDAINWDAVGGNYFPENASVLGGSGNDTINVSGHGLTRQHDYHVYGNAGDDLILGSTEDDVLVGDEGNDYIIGNNDGVSESDSGDVLVGGAGNDTILADIGNDYICGDSANVNGMWITGTGSDILYGDAGNDNIWGDAGDDSLGGGTGADVLYGGQGNDKLWGSYVGDDHAMDVFVFRMDEGQQVDEIMDFESGFDGIWCQDGAFTKAEIHGNDLWAYAGDDRGMIIHNAVGKEVKWANADGKINVYRVG